MAILSVMFLTGNTVYSVLEVFKYVRILLHILITKGVQTLVTRRTVRLHG